MILTSNHLVSRTAWTFSASQYSAFVHWLINATKSIVLVFALVLSITVVWTWFVAHSCLTDLLSWLFIDNLSSVFDFSYFFNFNNLSYFRFVSDLINNLTLFKTFLSNPFHFLLRNWFSGNSLGSINGNKFLTSDPFEMISWNQLGIRNIGILFLDYDKITKLWSSLVFNLLYCPLLTIDDWAASGV